MHENLTKLVALLGYPVEHSRSPEMQNAAFEALGLDWRYQAIPVPPDRFEEVLRELPGRGFVGANVTIPHKVRALQAADSVTAVAKAVGAANTLTLGDGRIVADNTDVEGFLAALRERMPGAPSGMRALVLGAGGAARAIAYALASEGAAEICVWNRHPERAIELVEDLDRDRNGRLKAIPEPDLRGAELLVNATSVGMREREGQAAERESFKQLGLSADNWGDLKVVVDIVYRDGETALAREATRRDITCVDGIDILVHQGAASFELWTGQPAPVEVMRHGARHR
jgi:shikimate dehydrogenase